MTGFATVRQQSRNWAWLAAYGVLLVALGLFAAMHPFLGDLALALYLGWALIASGAFGIVAAARTLRQRGHAFDALLGLFSIAAGFVVLMAPFTGVFAVALALMAWLAVSGATRIVAGLRIRGERLPLLASGALNLLLFALLVTNPAWMNLIVLSLLFAISLIGAGLMAIGTAWRLRHVASRFA